MRTNEPGDVFRSGADVQCICGSIFRGPAAVLLAVSFRGGN